MNDDEQETEMPKIVAMPAPDQSHEQGSIKGALSKLVIDLQVIDKARNDVEQRGIEYHNQAQQLLIENEDRVAETDRAINAEEDLVDACNTGIAELQATVKEHGANLALLRIERQARLDTIHNLKSNNIG